MTVEQKVKLTADTTGLKEIEAANRRAFSPASMREYKREGKELERSHGQLNRRVIELTRSMRGLEKGAEAFKNMRKELRGVQQEAKLVATALQAVQRVTASRPGSGSFVAGLGQGTGLGQYIPTGPGMGARMGGMAIGGAMRRGAGMAAAPFAMPGVGGVSQALGGIPLIGGALAGALQQAAGTYQSAVGYDRSLLSVTQFAGEGPTGAQRADFRRRNAARAAAIRASAGISSDVKTSGEATVRAAATAGAVTAATNAAISIARSPNRWMTGGAGEDTPATTGGALNVSIPGLSAGASAMLLKKATREQKAELLASKIEGRRLDTGRGMPGMGAGTAFGLGPQQMMSLFGEMMGARGGLAPDVSTSAFRGAMAAKTRFGVGGGLAGQFMRMGVAGGGGTGGMDLATVLQSATEQGLRGSQVVEYLKRMVEFGSKAEQSGVKINPSEMIKSSAMMRGLGMQGLQASRIAGGIQQAGMNLAARGVSGPMDMLLLKAAGFEPGQGAEGYAAALEKAETPSSSLVERFLGNVVAGAGGVGGPKMQALMVKRVLGKAGVPIGMKQASKWISGFEGGELTPEVRADIEAMTARGERAGAGGRMEKEAIRRVGDIAPTARGAAALEVQRIGAGRKAAPYIVGMERNAIATSNIMSNFGGNLKQLNGLVADLVKTADKWTKGGLEEMIAKIAAAITGGALNIGGK